MTWCTCKHIHIKRHQLHLNIPQREEFKGVFGQISYANIDTISLPPASRTNLTHNILFLYLQLLHEAAS